MNAYPTKHDHDLMPNPLPFRSGAAASTSSSSDLDLTSLPKSAEEMFDALDTMSRRIDDLARELHCLGYFDDDGDDGPRAA